MARVAELIRADHKEFRRLFSELRDQPTRSLVAPVLMALLAAHARAEESYVYPALRGETDGADDVEQSQEEHVEGDRLAARPAHTDFDDPSFDEILHELVESVSHHLREEEESVLPKLDALPSDEQDALAHAFLESRAERLTAGVTDITRDELQRQAANEGLRGTS